MLSVDAGRWQPSTFFMAQFAWILIAVGVVQDSHFLLLKNFFSKHASILSYKNNIIGARTMNAKKSS